LTCKGCCSTSSSVGFNRERGYGLDSRGVAIRVPARNKVFLFTITSRQVLGSTYPSQLEAFGNLGIIFAILAIGLLGAVSPRVKRPGREAHHRSSSSAEANFYSPYVFAS
jgi:hypothetical protein